MTNLDIVEETAIARPLDVLVPLIKEDFEKAEKAGWEYNVAAGAKLNEATEDKRFKDKPKSIFMGWAEKTFGKKQAQIRTYMAAASVGSTKVFKNLEHFRRAPKEEGGLGQTRETKRVFRDWTAPVDALAARARAEQRRLGEAAEMTRREERKAEAQLGLRLIDIGYKVLARELHPDKAGGSREAMTRLNRVRDRLRANV